LTILVLGAAGQVGRALAERGGAKARGFTRTECDILDMRMVERTVATPGLSVVVNCAGYTAVDRAESERTRAFSVNAEGAGIVARAAAARGLPVIHLSTDYVYDGRHNGPYLEDDSIAPINVYGASKAAGDAVVADCNPAHLVLRVSWVFGVHGNNFVKTMLRLSRERDELRIVDDQVGGPTEARDIADAILDMAAGCGHPEFEAWGVYHFAGAPSTSWYGFARAIFERVAGPSPILTPIASGDYRTAAARPLNSVLECTRIRRAFHIEQPNWGTSLDRVLSALGALRGRSPNG
jgi:dTDP-4-dehydrorhamnose reductase